MRDGSMRRFLTAVCAEGRRRHLQLIYALLSNGSGYRELWCGHQLTCGHHPRNRRRLLMSALRPPVQLLMPMKRSTSDVTLKGKVWTPIGPSPISGRWGDANGLVSAIAVSPSNPNIIFMGTGSGGLW